MNDVASVLAWSEALTMAGTEDYSAWLWTPTETTAVVGLSQNVEVELHLGNLQQDNIPVIRRASGGGAVILSRGMLCWGVIGPASELTSIGESYKVLADPVLEVCRELGLKATVSGISDIAATTAEGLFKIAGTAQLRKRNAVLVHGSLLIDADTSLFEKYLRSPSEMPDYRKERSHSEFCQTLSEILGRPITVVSVAEQLARACNERNWSMLEVPKILGEETIKLREKYLGDNWNLRRIRPLNLNRDN